MSSRSVFAAVLTALALPLGAQAQDFEGKVTYRMSAGGMTMDMVQQIKGKRMRQETETPMGNMVVVMDMEAGRMSMLGPGQTTPTVMTMEEMQAMSGQAANPDDVEVTATGEKETIAGHECEHFTVKQGATEMDVCAAKGLGFFAGSMGGQAGGGWEKLRDRFSDGFFPLKITAPTPQGSMTMELVSLEQMSLSDDLFKIEGGQ